MRINDGEKEQSRREQKRLHWTIILFLDPLCRICFSLLLRLILSTIHPFDNLIIFSESHLITVIVDITPLLQHYSLSYLHYFNTIVTLFRWTCCHWVKRRKMKHLCLRPPPDPVHPPHTHLLSQAQPISPPTLPLPPTPLLCLRHQRGQEVSRVYPLVRK
jgi:hypothetical protein